jgi:hypothetical protein
MMHLTSDHSSETLLESEEKRKECGVWRYGGEEYYGLCAWIHSTLVRG